MAPETKTGLRRIATLLVSGMHAVLAYEVHRFEGWMWSSLIVLDCVLLAVVVRLAMTEGRERERAGRG